MTALLEQHRKIKARLVEHYQALATTATSVGMATLAGDIQSTRIPKIEQERFHLVVLGEFNHGKSTFVNAMLGADVLPVGITPTTAAINHVVYGESPMARVVLRSGEEKPLRPEEIEKWVTVAGNQANEVSYVELAYPSALLKENITLVDTPGVNDLNEQRADVTYGYVPRADAVIFLLDAGQALKDSEREFLAGHVLEGTRDRLLFVLGKTDLLSPNEQKDVLEYVKKGLSKLVPDPVVFPLSARAFLQGDRAGSGMNEFLAHLSHMLDTDRSRVVLDNAATDVARTAAYLQQNLGVRLRSFELDVADLESRVQSVRKQLDTSKRTLDELHGKIEAEARAIKAQCALDLREFARVFTEALPEQIDAADADDVKRYLGAFVEDKFREWSELEGQKVGILLEKLAENVIAVTNENVTQASAALASRLGPKETDVDIEVDSFRYDVGVYAVGALGTTLFLFVNTLAGGLLTLTAPILAIVVKSKVAGDIRQQAKARVPVAIERAAAAMAPHFESCVDDFAKRLSEFVTSAGNVLYKGISEVLDRTLSERTRGKDKIDVLREQTEAHVSRVKALRESVSSLREGLWKSPTL